MSYEDVHDATVSQDTTDAATSPELDASVDFPALGDGGGPALADSGPSNETLPDASVPSADASLSPVDDALTTMTIPGTQLLNESFESDAWKTKFSPYAAVATVVDGQLRVAVAPAVKHPAEIGYRQRMRDVVAQFRFRLEGAGYLGIQFSDDKQTFHVANMMVGKTRVNLNQVTGWGGTTKFKNLDYQDLTVGADEWHTARVELRGSEILAQIDDGCLLYGSVPALDVDKTKFALQSGGQYARYDDIKAWEAIADPTWPARKAAVLAASGCH